MKRLIMFSAAPLLAACAFAAPAAAQDDTGERVNQLIVYGDDECPVSDGETITVCARLDEGERFRIPQNLRESQSPANESWARRVRSYETVGNFGVMSCTPVGAGGDLGCTPQFIEAAYAERAQGSEVRFSQLIEEARAERLSEIDAEAAATQARVEELERQYMLRLERERAAELPGEEAPPSVLQAPRVVDPSNIPE